MITGDQALPQPDDIQDPVIGEWRPTLPEAVLRREALLRSFRWVFVVMGGLSIWGISSAFFSFFRMGGLSNPARMAAAFLPTLIYSTLGISKCVIGFWALSTPTRMTRALMLGLVGLCVLSLTYLAYNYSTFSSTSGAIFSPERKYYIGLFQLFMTLPEQLIIFYLVFLTRTGRGKLLYEPEGLAYFAQEQTEKGAENPWFAVGYFIFVMIRWTAATQISRALYTH